MSNEKQMDLWTSSSSSVQSDNDLSDREKLFLWGQSQNFPRVSFEPGFAMPGYGMLSIPRGREGWAGFCERADILVLMAAAKAVRKVGEK